MNKQIAERKKLIQEFVCLLLFRVKIAISKTKTKRCRFMLEHYVLHIFSCSSPFYSMFGGSKGENIRQTKQFCANKSLENQ